MDTDQILREHLVKLLDSKWAHASVDNAIEGIPPEYYGKQPEGLPYSPWQLLEHLRIAQWDILDFCRNPDYKEMKWPDDYWPSSIAPSSPEDWNKSVAAFRADLEAMRQMAMDPATDLYATIPHGDGQTYLREIMLVADHNAYHVGQIVLVRRLLGIWK